MDFIEPIKYPLRDIRKLIVGGLLIFPGILLLIPCFIISGYMIKVAGETVKGKDALPGFDDPIYLIKKGLGSFAISVVYSIIMLVAFIPCILLFIAAAKVNSWMALLFILLGMIFLLIAFLIMLLLSLMQYIAYVRYGERGNFAAGFDFKEIFRNFKNNFANYAVGFIILMGVSFVGSFIIIPLEILFFVMMELGVSITPIIILGIVIGLFMVCGALYGIFLFYYMLVLIRMFAKIYAEKKVA